MKTRRYILDANDKPKLEPDLITWAKWFEAGKRRVAEDQIGDIRISTVFLGSDHSWSGGPPVLWETMVFGGPLDQEQDRCAGNREQAEAMHEAMVARVNAPLAEKSDAEKFRPDG